MKIIKVKEKEIVNEEKNVIVNDDKKSYVSRKITFINLVMTLGIVLYHFYGYYNQLPMYDTPDIKIFNMFNYFAENMGTIGLGMFFLMSGFLLYNNCNNTKDMMVKAKKRLKTLGIPFLVWNAIIFIYMYIRTYKLPFEGGIKGFIIKMTLVPFDGGLWYVFALILLLLPALLIIKLKNKKILSTIFLIVVCVFGYSFSCLNIFPSITASTYGFWIERLIRYLPIYFIGAYVGMHYSDVIWQEKYNNKIIVPLFLLLYIINIYVCRKTSSWHVLWIAMQLKPILLWFCISSSIFKKDFGLPAKCSFMVYAMHGPIWLSIFENIVTPHMLSGYTFYPFQIVLVKIAVVLLVYISSVIVTYILKKTMKEKYFNMLSGGRI